MANGMCSVRATTSTYPRSYTKPKKLKVYTVIRGRCKKTYAKNIAPDMPVFKSKMRCRKVVRGKRVYYVAISVQEERELEMEEEREREEEEEEPLY